MWEPDECVYIFIIRVTAGSIQAEIPPENNYSSTVKSHRHVHVMEEALDSHSPRTIVLGMVVKMSILFSSGGLLFDSIN